jgi:hypothetical protein
VSAVVVLGAGLLVAAYVTNHQDEPPGTGGVAGGAPAGTVAATPAPIGGALTGSPAPAATKKQKDVKVGVAAGPVAVRYTFDGGLGRSIAGVDGRFPLRPISQNDGMLTFNPRDGGFAMQFPARCRLDEKVCPRAILEGTPADALNPGTRPLQYGASVLMTHDDLADGANVVQKGYSVGGFTQFKLQVDHLAGRPSCVIASTKKIYKVEPKLDIADGAWHKLACARTGAKLTITIDGVPSGAVAVPMALSIANAEPLRIGGKGANVNNDQYAGQIDDVFLTIS